MHDLHGWIWTWCWSADITLFPQFPLRLCQTMVQNEKWMSSLPSRRSKSRINTQTHCLTFLNKQISLYYTSFYLYSNDLESSMFSALGSAIDGMLGEAFRDGIRTGANEIRNEARRARDEARRAAQRDRAEARAQHERHHRNSHNRNNQNQYRPNSSRPSRNTNQRAGIPSIDEIIGDAFGSFDELFRNHQNTHNHFHQQGNNLFLLKSLENL